jgi:hypothetical protein
MDEKALWFMSITTTLLSCGLLGPIWLVVLFIVYLVKIFSRPKPVPQPKIILPSNEFASDWTFVIREVIE